MWSTRSAQPATESRPVWSSRAPGRGCISRKGALLQLDIRKSAADERMHVAES